MGCIGMSLDDFERSTPSEFSRIYDRWADRETRHIRDAWERTRTLVAFVLPIYRAKRSAKQLLPFPWDHEKENAAPKGSGSIERMKELEKSILHVKECDTRDPDQG